MKIFPESAIVQLEFDKVKFLLAEHCRGEYAKQKAENLRIHTRLDFISGELEQSHEYSQILRNGIYFPNDSVFNLARELRLLEISGAVLSEEQLVAIRRLTAAAESIFRWFDSERKIAHPGLSRLLNTTTYEKKIQVMIDQVLDEGGQVKDSASEELERIRMSLYKRRNELRKMFERVIQKLNKQGYLADIEESFINGRKVVAVFAEQKRMVKGILHGESDTRRTSFIEPEETIGLNNEVFSLENEEKKEVYRILRELTARLSVFAPQLHAYWIITGELDFIYAKARLAIDMNAEYPVVTDKAQIHLVNAYHPLLYLYNKKTSKQTIPVSLTLDEKSRILVISGPNAGGKTVTMKTIGLIQLMVQSGLLVPLHPSSTLGIFKQVMIHIGDTQSLEFELSTYSSHLKNMKYFMESANGRTLFFIDELGSGSDPNLGGAFAEVIMEELARKHAYGIVTTHYLNLKIMANKVQGIINGAMAFDEKNLLPMYRLIVGKPGSSYTFSIAERIGLDKRLIEKARGLVDENHFTLDKLLNRTEQDLQVIETEKKELKKLLTENERLKKEMTVIMDKERHRQQVEILKQQNAVTEEKLAQLKDTDRKLKQIVAEWRRAEDKNVAIKEIQQLLFKKDENRVTNKLQKKVDARYQEVNGDVKVGDQVKMKRNHQVGSVLEIRGKRAVVKIGMLPMQVDLQDLVLVQEKEQDQA